MNNKLTGQNIHDIIEHIPADDFCSMHIEAYKDYSLNSNYQYPLVSENSIFNKDSEDIFDECGFADRITEKYFEYLCKYPTTRMELFDGYDVNPDEIQAFCEGEEVSDDLLEILDDIMYDNYSGLANVALLDSIIEWVLENKWVLRDLKLKEISNQFL